MKIIEPTGHAGFALARGDHLHIIDIEGGQVADLVTFGAGDKTEWLSNGRSIDYSGGIYFTTGATLYSNRSRPMLTIVEDTVGRHDFLYTACSEEMYRIQYGASGHHVNCLDNLTKGLEPLGVGAHEMPTPFNVFMNVAVGEDGTLEIRQPLSNKSDAIVLRAEMALVGAISACPAPSCNGGRPKPIGYDIRTKTMDR